MGSFVAVLGVAFTYYTTSVGNASLKYTSNSKYGFSLYLRPTTTNYGDETRPTSAAAIARYGPPLLVKKLFPLLATTSRIPLVSR